MEKPPCWESPPLLIFLEPLPSVTIIFLSLLEAKALQLTFKLAGGVESLREGLLLLSRSPGKSKMTTVLHGLNSAKTQCPPNPTWPYSFSPVCSPSAKAQESSLLDLRDGSSGAQRGAPARGIQ
uniref:Uncharacterized protein n=1 Tax=Molossus molossus TaxID=27622 RepID=A0A7J8HC04_MOLMO|nr:hypothetical protein HJG59_011174 [Molossus molossus]